MITPVLICFNVCSYELRLQEIDPKSGGGDAMTVGEMCRRLLRKLDWYATMFPRIPVKFAKEIDEKLKNYRVKKLEEAKGEKAQNEKEEAAETYDELMAKHIREQGQIDTARYVVKVTLPKLLITIQLPFIFEHNSITVVDYCLILGQIVQADS